MGTDTLLDAVGGGWLGTEVGLGRLGIGGLRWIGCREGRRWAERRLGRVLAGAGAGGDQVDGDAEQGQAAEVGPANAGVERRLVGRVHALVGAAPARSTSLDPLGSGKSPGRCYGAAVAWLTYTT